MFKIMFLKKGYYIKSSFTIPNIGLKYKAWSFRVKLNELGLLLMSVEGETNGKMAESFLGHLESSVCAAIFIFIVPSL